jgi:hypothetical protein
MEPDDPQPARHREMLLSIVLSSMLGFFILVFLVIITGGFIFWLGLIGLAMGGFATLHYYWWGRNLTQEVAGEREEEELRDQARADDWPLPEPRRHQR